MVRLPFGFPRLRSGQVAQGKRSPRVVRLPFGFPRLRSGQVAQGKRSPQVNCGPTEGEEGLRQARDHTEGGTSQAAFAHHTDWRASAPRAPAQPLTNRRPGKRRLAAAFQRGGRGVHMGSGILISKRCPAGLEEVGVGEGLHPVGNARDRAREGLLARRRQLQMRTLVARRESYRRPARPGMVLGHGKSGAAAPEVRLSSPPNLSQQR
jgi:hypothetical protein